MAALLLPEAHKPVIVHQQTGHKEGIAAFPRAAKANGSAGAPGMTRSPNWVRPIPRKAPADPGSPGKDQGL